MRSCITARLGFVATVALASACVVPVDVGEVCAPFQVNEFSFARRAADIPETDVALDFIELRIDPSFPGEVDLDGYYLRHGETGYSSRITVDEPLDDDEGPRFLLILANTYDQDVDRLNQLVADDTASWVPPVVLSQVFFDFNNDGNSFAVLAPDELYHAVCAQVNVTTGHRDMSWQHDGRGGWCQGNPSPGWENEGCLCDDNDDC